jgi:pimeloyl-ACP methyl ester carboxylesterase
MRAILIVFLLLVSLPARALEPGSTGVVLMHGKWGNAGQLTVLSAALKEAGFPVENLTLPWAGSRLYDRSYDEGLDEVAAAAGRLEAAGAKRIVVVGHSLGANGALAYSLGHAVAAVVLIAPGHFPDGDGFRKCCADDVARARTMVAKGEDDDGASFTDPNSDDRKRVLAVSARRYLSYMDPDGPAAMSLAAVKAGPAPVLWIAPTGDRLTEVFARLVLPRFPAGVRLDKVEVGADHMGAVSASTDKVVGWLKAVE